MKTMSKKNTALVLVGAALAMGLGLVLAPNTLQAQQLPPLHSHGDGDCHARGDDVRRVERSPAERLAHWQQMLGRVSERLQLNPRQVAEAQRILVDVFARAQQLHSSTADRTPERRAGRDAMMQQADARFIALLTPQQRLDWTALKAEFRARRGGLGGHHDGSGHGGDRGHDDDRGEGSSRGPRTEAQRGI